ncbi:hypothetical protein GF361_05995 [Candidatus Woesearchaeota archaeon]|nr:hypothetical protein [Candidatus Woesearchaeota archaeon]
MKIKQPTLINFSTYQILGMFDNKIIQSMTGIYHTKREHCPICGKLGSYNGSSNKGKHDLSRSTGSYLRLGQQRCTSCNEPIPVNNEWFLKMKEKIRDFIKSIVISLSSSLSEEEIKVHLEEVYQIKIPKSTIHKIKSIADKEISSLEFEYKVKEGWYGYDEQHIKIKGKKAYRIVIFDLELNDVIYENIHFKLSKKILKKILTKVFPDKKPLGFVVDMLPMYSKAFKAAFGRRFKLQFCVFHLNKLILKEYRESITIGKVAKWSLVHYYNLYTLLAIFYNRNDELNHLKKLMKHFNNFKENLTPEKVQMYVQKYSVKTKKFETQKRNVIHIIEIKLMKAFRQRLKQKKQWRKRYKKTLLVRPVELAKYIFDKIFFQKMLYPKKIQDRLVKIKDNFDYFIASDGLVMTNNKLEGHFGATLKKFRKKLSKSVYSLSAILKRKHLRRLGKAVVKSFSLADLAQVFLLVSFLS